MTITKAVSAYMQNRLTNSQRYFVNAKPGTNHSTKVRVHSVILIFHRKWKMDTQFHFPFFIANGKWKMDIYF